MIKKLRNRLTTGYWESKRFIKLNTQKLTKVIKKASAYLLETHNTLASTNVYENLTNQLVLVLSNGFIIWIVFVGLGYLTGFWKLANPLLILPYGIVPWWMLLYYKEIKEIKNV